MNASKTLNPIVVAWAVLASSQFVSAQIVIPPSVAAPAGSINTNAPGFKVRTFLVTGLQVNHVDIAESLIMGTRIDPTTGLPYENLADDPGPIVIETVVNWDGNLGPEATAAGNFRNDVFFPGIPPSANDYVLEVTGFLQLPAGTHRLGVNSDDGFKLTIGTGVNPYDAFAVRLPGIDTTRGQANTDTAITITSAGIYPYRLLYWERSGDSRLEFSNFTPGTTTGGTRYLINDSTQANAFKSYREPVTPFDKPYPILVDPGPGVNNAPPAPYIRVNLQEQAVTVDLASPKITLDGTDLVSTATRTGTIVTVGAQAALFDPNSQHTATLTYRDSAGNSVTNTWQFTISNYPTIPADYAATGVNTTMPGFRARTHQIPIGRGPAVQGFDGNFTPAAERQLAEGFIDPDTGAPYANTADLSGAGPDGFFVVPGVINVSQVPGIGMDFGNFQDDSVPPYPDDPVPGITGANDNYVVEFRTYLALKAGPLRLGVNSDDGFKVSVSRSPGDLNGLLLGQFSGGRGSADSVFDFLVPADGIYPFRLLWWEGGSESNCEFFSVDLATGNRTLINDPASPIKAYREASVVPPYVSKVLPAAGSILVVPTADVVVEITDGTIPVDANSINFVVNGTAVTGASKVGNITTIRRAGGVNNLLLGGANNATLVYGFTEGGQTVLVTNTWSFTAGGTTGANQGPPYVVIPPGNKVPAGSVNTNVPGFKILRVSQIDRSLDGIQGNGDRFPGDANRMPRPEIQLENGYINPADTMPYPNLADLSAFVDGVFNVDDVFDFGQLGNNAGLFNPTTAMPGMPGQGTSPSATPAEIGTDNFVLEMVTYLELKAGGYVMSVNSDDGYVLSSAPHPRDTLGTVVGFWSQGGGSQNPPGRWLSFVVLEDGIYPFRLTYWEGGGGSNVEWLSLDPGNAQRIRINDLSSPIAIKAYREYTGPARPWVKFSVCPTPWDNITQQVGPGPIILAGRTPSSVDATDQFNRVDLVNNATTVQPWADVNIGAVLANLGAGPVRMLLDGNPVEPTITTSGSDTMVAYKPSPPLPSDSMHTASLIYAGVTNSWSFRVQTYTNLAESLALPPSAADASAIGFRARVMKIQNGTANIAGNLQRAEDHLRGVLTNPNTAVPGPEPDGSYIISGILNWNQEVRGGNNTQIGNFRMETGFPDDPIPGVGLGTTGEATNANDLISAEVFAYLELPAGYVRMGVNSDDGFRVTAATGYDANAPVLGVFDAGKGASDIALSFVTPIAGLYPIRLVWFEGTGGANLEFFSYGPNGEKIPVNARANPNAIKAYYKVTTTPGIRITSISIAGGTVTINWTGGGTLYSATSLNPGTTWTSTGDDDGSYTASVGAGNLFFRVQQ
jgi:hypothetical protein